MLRRSASVSVLLGMLLLVSVVVVAAAPPHVHNSIAPIVVNGNSSDWDTSTAGADFFM